MEDTKWNKTVAVLGPAPQGTALLVLRNDTIEVCLLGKYSKNKHEIARHQSTLLKTLL